MKVMKFIRRLKYIKKWIPILWNHYDCDYDEVYQLLYHKIDFMIKQFENTSYYWNVENDIKKMKIARATLKRILDDEYHTLEYNKIKDYLYNRINKYILKEKIETLSDEYSEIVKKNLEHETYMRKQDKEFLFKQFNKYLDFWWY